MWFKHRAWIPISWLLSILNIAGAGVAGISAEPWHVTVHALLAVMFGVGAERLAARQRALSDAEEPGIASVRMRRLEEAIEAIAVEVERIGEGQRFVTKLLAEPARASSRSQPSREDPVPARITRRDPEG